MDKSFSPVLAISLRFVDKTMFYPPSLVEFPCSVPMYVSA